MNPTNAYSSEPFQHRGGFPLRPTLGLSRRSSRNPEYQKLTEARRDEVRSILTVEDRERERATTLRFAGVSTWHKGGKAKVDAGSFCAAGRISYRGSDEAREWGPGLTRSPCLHCGVLDVVSAGKDDPPDPLFY